MESSGLEIHSVYLHAELISPSHSHSCSPGQGHVAGWGGAVSLSVSRHSVVATAFIGHLLWARHFA